MKRTAIQNKKLHLYLGALGWDAERKKDLVYSYTNHRTEKSSEMTSDECRKLLRFLSTKIDAMDKMRKKIIALLKHELGFTMKDIDAFCETKGTFKKKLQKHNHNELVQLVTQVQQYHKVEFKKQLKT